MQVSTMPRLQGWGIAILRVVTGVVFLMSGGHKLFTQGLSEVANLVCKFLQTVE